MLLKCVIFVYDIINLESLWVPFLCDFVRENKVQPIKNEQ